MTVTIEKNVDFPRTEIGPLPLDKMEPGDSFFYGFDNREERDARIRTIRMRTMRYTQKLPDVRFSVLKAKEGGRYGVRVFRRED